MKKENVNWPTQLLKASLPKGNNNQGEKLKNKEREE